MYIQSFFVILHIACAYAQDSMRMCICDREVYVLCHVYFDTYKVSWNTMLHRHNPSCNVAQSAVVQGD